MIDLLRRIKGVFLYRVVRWAYSYELYEECPVCEGEGGDEFGPCVWCDGEGVVPHDCEKA